MLPLRGVIAEWPPRGWPFLENGGGGCVAWHFVRPNGQTEFWLDLFFPRTTPSFKPSLSIQMLPLASHSGTAEHPGLPRPKMGGVSGFPTEAMSEQDLGRSLMVFPEEPRRKQQCVIFEDLEDEAELQRWTLLRPHPLQAGSNTASLCTGRWTTTKRHVSRKAANANRAFGHWATAGDVFQELQRGKDPGSGIAHLAEPGEQVRGPRALSMGRCRCWWCGRGRESLSAKVAAEGGSRGCDQAAILCCNKPRSHF